MNGPLSYYRSAHQYQNQLQISHKILLVLNNFVDMNWTASCLGVYVHGYTDVSFLVFLFPLHITHQWNVLCCNCLKLIATGETPGSCTVHINYYKYGIIYIINTLVCHYKSITGNGKAYNAVLEGNFPIVISKFIQKDIMCMEMTLAMQAFMYICELWDHFRVC